MELTKQRFEQNYCLRSSITLDFYKEHFVTLPCACKADTCEGWAAVSNNPQALKSHLGLYA